MNVDQSNQSGEKEPSPTSTPPSDVEIPVESIYGDNRPIPPVASTNTNINANTTASEVNSQKEDTPNQKRDTSTFTPTEGGKSLKIGFIPFILLMLLTVFGVFTLGNKFRVNIKEGIPSITQTLPSTTESGENKQKRMINFLKDRGVYKAENPIRGPQLAKSRIKLAEKTVIWVTSEPNNQEMLAILSNLKKTSPIPIFIVVGSDISAARIRPAMAAGLEVSRLDSSLEIPYSILIIDAKVVMDISRDHWVWETSDKDIIKETANWANQLIMNAKILNPNENNL